MRLNMGSPWKPDLDLRKSLAFSVKKLHLQQESLCYLIQAFDLIYSNPYFERIPYIYYSHISLSLFERTSLSVFRSVQMTIHLK